MRSWTFAAIAAFTVLLVGIGVFLLVGRAPAPPTAFADPLTPTVQQTQAVPGGSVDAGMLALTLPAGWRFVTGEWPVGVTPEISDAAPVVIAWRDADTFATAPVRLSIIAVARNALSLEQYVGDIERQLVQTAGVSAVTTQITTGLRHDSLPAGEAVFAIASAAGVAHAAQAVMLDPPAQHLVISSLVVPAANGDAADLLQTLMQSVRFRE